MESMMALDIVYVSYNSEKWITKCFDSVMKSDYDLSKVSIYVVDNASTDNSVKMLQETKARYEAHLNKFEVISSNQNLGFGKANNLGFRHGSAPIVCFFNIDTEVCTDTLRLLTEDIETSEESFVLWELRQFPYEHPKMYDALTHEVSWSSGAAFSMKRSVYEEVGGFDEAIFMYAEDVDLSWRLRSFGYRLKYVPKAVIYHYSYESAGQIKPNQYLNSVINNLLLRYRFGCKEDILKGHAMVLKQLMIPEPFQGAHKKLFKLYLSHFGKTSHFRNRKLVGNAETFKPTFLGFDYDTIRDGAFYENEFPEQEPLVSIIVRTCGRPDVLRETLQSLRLQTYSNIEVVVVEDGPDTAGQMIKNEFGDMNIIYQPTNEKGGRSKAGNKAMELAHGKYLNFLDDDDLFYADHVEVLVKTLEREKTRAAYAFGFETPIIVRSRSPYDYTVTMYRGVYKQPFSKLELCYHNYIPIQCIMFEKSLFEEYGGLDETLDSLEDWDLWVRYSLHTDFACVQKTTSIYRVPYDRKIDAKRQKDLDDALVVVRNKHKSYQQLMSVYELAKLYEREMR